MRYIPKWLIEENRKIREQDEKNRSERAYNSGCSEARLSICRTFQSIVGLSNCIDLDNGKCPLMAKLENQGAK